MKALLFLDYRFRHLPSNLAPEVGSSLTTPRPRPSSLTALCMPRAPQTASVPVQLCLLCSSRRAPWQPGSRCPAVGEGERERWEQSRLSVSTSFDLLSVQNIVWILTTVQWMGWIVENPVGLPVSLSSQQQTFLTAARHLAARNQDHVPQLLLQPDVAMIKFRTRESREEGCVICRTSLWRGRPFFCFCAFFLCVEYECEDWSGSIRFGPKDESHY